MTSDQRLQNGGRPVHTVHTVILSYWYGVRYMDTSGYDWSIHNRTYLIDDDRSTIKYHLVLSTRVPGTLYSTHWYYTIHSSITWRTAEYR